jgi:hypothetical protein
MGNKINPSCLRPQIEDNFDTNSEYQIRNNRRYKYRKISENDSLSAYSNKSYSFYTRKNMVDKKNPSYIDKVKIIQKNIRYYLSLKKFNDKVDLLTNILELDSTVNLIKDKITENKLLMNNAGEQLSLLLIKQRKITKYEYTRYYRMNIKKYKPNRYLIKTPLTYIDKYKNNDLYIGTWTLEKKFHGYGIHYTCGNKYEGFWNFGKLVGEARKFFQNNDYYLGTFNEGSLSSFGKYYHKDGTTYEGNWFKNQPHGEGKEIFVDGSKFEGIFENGYKRKGKFTWIDGSFYDGEIKDNAFDGYGKFKWKEGRIYVGFWKKGKMNGKGVMTYIDGAKYEGEFVEGKRDGKGNYYWNVNKYYKGNWKKGKQEGDGYYYNKGRGIIGVWKDGKIKQCLSQEINKELLENKINNDRTGSPMKKNKKINDNFYDSINLSTNLSSNSMSMKDIRIKNGPNDNSNSFHSQRSNRSNRTFIDQKYNCNESKFISSKKSVTDISVVSDYSITKSKGTNIGVLFRNNINNNNNNFTYTSSRKSFNTKNPSDKKIWKNSSFYKKNKNK